MRSPGTFTSGELTFEAGSTVCLFHCRVWVSNELVDPMEKYMTGLFVLEDYQPVDPAAYAMEAGWLIYPAGGWPTVVGGDIIEPVIIKDEEGLCLFVTMGDLWPQLDPSGYASMLVQEKEMDLWNELEMSGM